MANQSGFTWDISPLEAFEPMFDQYERAVRLAVKQVCAYFAPQIETWMKENASWTDRTGNLRQSLHAEVEEMVNEIAINFDYGLDYGVYLAYGNAGKFDIIRPALDHFAPQVIQMLQQVLGS